MASDIFAKIGDIKGESVDAKHKDEIEVLSFSWGVTNAANIGGGGGGGAGKATFQDLSIVHKIDKASPKLLKACATGTHLKEATITHRKAGKGQQEYLIVKMNDVIITGVAHGGTQRAAGIGDREPRVCQGRPRVQAAEGRRLARCGDSFQVRHQGQQSRLAFDWSRREDLPGQLMEPSESPTRELTLEEAVSFAILLQKNEQFAEAHELYRRVLEAAPDHPRALHYAGVLAHQQGRNDEALALIERSLALEPDQADWCSNLGIVLQSDDRLDAAIDAYRRAIAIDPSHANAHNNLGVLLRATGQPVEAEAAYRAAIRLNPEHIDAYTNLGILLNGLKRTEEAAACYCKVITLRPKHREARKLLALAHCMLGEIGEAGEHLRRMARRRARGPDCAAHAGGLHGSRCAGARVKRFRRDNLRQFCVELRSEARDAVVSCAGARRGNAGGFRP